ncbi:STAS domain-containing protein [Bacillus lacus]|uniref:STAS domain-containing protein n=1 Tax=Metabacillus lacus TaxID=1983721 RepID=A0A7X2IZM8_9BACI|nr:STAS domain-containing protein [Metabacillus lacus]MRX72088.1 STAS domain-containing protein [Metabacillus lacus]
MQGEAGRFLQAAEANYHDLIEGWTNKLKEIHTDKPTDIVSDHIYTSLCTEYVNIVIGHLKNGGKDLSKDLNEEISDFSQKAVQLGWTLRFLSKGLRDFNVILFEKITGNLEEQEKMKIVWEFDRLLNPVNGEILHQYALSWERTVSLQKIALQELSAPLIPVFDNITVMPLVGTIDTERAKRIMENLLQGVVKHRAQVVLIDITGVPVVDTMVAHHIIQASEAVRLVGAKCLLVGIRPEIAQTIVNLGINLNQVTTKNSLQKGIEAALEMTSRKIVSSSEA